MLRFNKVSDNSGLAVELNCRVIGYISGYGSVRITAADVVFSPEDLSTLCEKAKEEQNKPKTLQGFLARIIEESLLNPF